MTTFTAKHFSIVEYIQELRKVNFTEEQAEAVTKIFEQQQQIIQEQNVKLTALESKEAATKDDINESELRLQKEIKKLEVKIEQYRYDNLKFIVWTGIGVVISLSGVMVTLFKLMSRGGF